MGRSLKGEWDKVLRSQPLSWKEKATSEASMPVARAEGALLSPDPLGIKKSVLNGGLQEFAWAPCHGQPASVTERLPAKLPKGRPRRLHL